MSLARFALAAAALAGVAAGVPAFACTPAPGYQVPGNLELVRQADTIVLGRVVGGDTASADDPRAGSIVIRPLEALKGEAPTGDITLAGMSLPVIRDGEVSGYELSNPFEFERAHEQAYAGGCIRTTFPLGTTAVFVLKRDGGGWAPAGGPFSRWAEDVPDAQAPWVQLVRVYAVAATLPEPDRVALLSDEREALMARTTEPLAQLMADDLARQVSAGPAAAAPDAAGREDTSFEDAFRDPAEKSSVDAALEAMRQGAAEAGN